MGQEHRNETRFISVCSTKRFKGDSHMNVNINGKALTIAAALSLLVGTSCTGCSTNGVTALPGYSGIEIEHISHPLAGFPFGPANEEDALSHLNGFVGWTKGRMYSEVTLGYSLADSGFYGPRLTG